MKARPLTEPASDQRCLVRGVVVEDEMDVEVQWHRVIDGVEKLAELHGAMAAMTPADHRAGLDVQCREERRRAMAQVVMGAAFGLARAHRQQWLRAIQRLDLRLLIGTQHEGAVRRIQVEPDDIAHLLHKERVLRKLEGFRPMRLQAEGAPDATDRALAQPQRAAIARVLQCVASRGLASSVSVTICSTCPSLMWRGAPGRGSSSKPSRRAARNQLRHLPTVCLVSRSSCATRVLVCPRAHANTTRARCANACAVVGRRAQRSNMSRSSSVSVNIGMGRPMAMSVLLSIARTLNAYTLFQLFRTHETSAAYQMLKPLLPKTVQEAVSRAMYPPPPPPYRFSLSDTPRKPSPFPFMVSGEDDVLSQLGAKYLPSKLNHNYLPYYWLHLRDIRYSAERILEIGLQTDHSIRMWEEFFPRATVY